jgi:hypothetical protein
MSMDVSVRKKCCLCLDYSPGDISNSKWFARHFFKELFHTSCYLCH